MVKHIACYLPLHKQTNINSGWVELIWSWVTLWKHCFNSCRLVLIFVMNCFHMKKTTCNNYMFHTSLHCSLARGTVRTICFSCIWSGIFSDRSGKLPDQSDQGRYRTGKCCNLKSSCTALYPRDACASRTIQVTALLLNTLHIFITEMKMSSGTNKRFPTLHPNDGHGLFICS